MKKIIPIVLVLIAMAFVGYASLKNVTPKTEETNLYSRLGGENGISKIVDEVVVAHSQNSIISARFAPYSDKPEKVALIKKHMVQLLSSGGGGPHTYEGKDMKTTHSGMNISSAEFVAALDDIMSVLQKNQIDQNSQNEVLAMLWSVKSQIISQ